MATDKEKPVKYVDVNPHEWPAPVGAAMEAFTKARENVSAAITQALRDVNLCPPDHVAQVGFNYGKFGLAVTIATGQPATKKSMTFTGFKPPAPALQPGKK